MVKKTSLKGDRSPLKGLWYITFFLDISLRIYFWEGHKVATNVDIIVNKYFLGVFL
jgi:hypothetical protein